MPSWPPYPARGLIADHLSRLQVAVSCVTPAVALCDRRYLWLSEQPAPLRGGYDLTVQQELYLTPSNQLKVVRYNYRVADADGQEVVAYHRHPGRHRYGHLHVPHGPLPKVAFPTEEVHPHEVIRFCIQELGVPPRRRDWANVLGRRSG